MPVPVLRLESIGAEMSIARLPPPAPSRRSLLALGWLNFFVSGMQAAFGPIAAAYLAAQGWTAKDIGFVLGIGGIASLVSQAPGGELLDAPSLNAWRGQST
jgi:hypothetical protein